MGRVADIYNYLIISYGVCIRYSGKGNHRIYGLLQCMHTVLDNARSGRKRKTGEDTNITGSSVKGYQSHIWYMQQRVPKHALIST